MYMEGDKNLALRQNLLKIWENHHLDFQKLHFDYEEIYEKMVEEKLRTGRNVFDHVMRQYPNIKLLQFENYGDARRFLCELDEAELIDLIEVLDDFFESVPYKELESATALYRDRLNQKNGGKTYAVVTGCYQRR